MTIDLYTGLGGEADQTVSPLRYKGLGDRLHSSWWDQASAAYNSGADYATRTVIGDMYTISELERDGPKVAPDVLSKKYEDLGLKFDKPQTETVAAFLANRKRRQMYLSGVLESGPMNPTASSLLGGLAANVVDPYELGLGFLTGGVLKAAGVTGGMARRFGTGFVAEKTMAGLDNMLGAGLLEKANYDHARMTLEDRDYTDTLEQLGYAFAAPFAIGGVAAGARLTKSGVSKLFDRYRAGGESVRPTPAINDVAKPGADKLQYDKSVDQFAGDRKVDVDPVARDAELESKPSGEPARIADEAFGKYVFTPIDTSRPFSGRMFVAGLPGKPFGDVGSHLSDDPRSANANAASKHSNQSNRVIHEINLNNANLLSADHFLTKNELNIMSASTKSAYIVDAISKVKDGVRLGELVSMISDSAKRGEQDVIDEISSIAKSITGTDVHGLYISDGSSNRIMLTSSSVSNVDGSVWSSASERPAIREALGGLPVDEALRIKEQNLSHKTSSAYDDVSEAVANQTSDSGKPFDAEKTSMLEAEELPAVVEQLQIDAKSGDVAAQSVLDQFAEADKAISMNEKIIKALSACMMKE